MEIEGSNIMLITLVKPVEESKLIYLTILAAPKNSSSLYAIL